MIRLTKILATFILVGVILSVTPQAWAMDDNDYGSWVTHVSRLSGALFQTTTTVGTIFVADVKRLKKEGNTIAISIKVDQTKKIFSKLSKATLELLSWAKEITPSDPAFSASHSYLKKGLEYQHLSFVAASTGNFDLSSSYAGKATKEFATASQLLLKVGDLYDSALEKMKQKNEELEEFVREKDREALKNIEKHIKKLEAKGENITDTEREDLKRWRSLRDQILKKE